MSNESTMGHLLPLKELQRRTGSLQQLAGDDVVTAENGVEHGVRKALVRTGAGPECTVYTDRGFDIGEVRFNGINMSWHSPIGAAQPHLHQDDKPDWLTRFLGGLRTTCGLDNVGPENQGRSMHGRYSHLPAQLPTLRSSFEGDRYSLNLTGCVQQYKLFGQHLVLTRSIRSEYGHHTLRVQDEAENRAIGKAPFLLLDHCTFGYPLLDESTILRLESEVTPRDRVAKQGLGTNAYVHAPQPRYREQVFFHDAKDDDAGVVSVRLPRPGRPAGVSRHYLKHQLPHFTQWKQLAEGANRLGIEPKTCQVPGFEHEAEAGRGFWLGPGKTRRFNLLFEYSLQGTPAISSTAVLGALA